MNRSQSKIKHIQRANILLEQRTRLMENIVPPPPESIPLDDPRTGEVANQDQSGYKYTYDTMKGFDENGNLVPNSDFKQYTTKPEVQVHLEGETVGPYFFRTKRRKGDSGNYYTMMVMYKPSTGQWFDLEKDMNVEWAKSQKNFTEDQAKDWLRGNGYLNKKNPFA